MSQDFLRNFDSSSTSTVKSCSCCGGSGSLVIKNAYDLSFEAVEVCNVCNGTGYVTVEKESYDLN